MTKCKWCEKDFGDKNFTYCNYKHQRMYEIYRTRKIIWDFANKMEQKMQEKDDQGYTHEDKSLEFLINKLREERAEVDFELIDLPSFEIDKELVDEAIMCMLVRHKIKNLTKGDLKCMQKQ